MGRTATKPKHAVELPELDSTTINQNIATMTEHSAEVMAQFGDGLLTTASAWSMRRASTWPSRQKPCWKPESA